MFLEARTVRPSHQPISLPDRHESPFPRWDHLGKGMEPHEGYRTTNVGFTGNQLNRVWLLLLYPICWIYKEKSKSSLSSGSSHLFLWVRPHSPGLWRAEFWAIIPGFSAVIHVLERAVCSGLGLELCTFLTQEVFTSCKYSGVQGLQDWWVRPRDCDRAVPAFGWDHVSSYEFTDESWAWDCKTAKLGPLADGYIL